MSFFSKLGQGFNNAVGKVSGFIGGNPAIGAALNAVVPGMGVAAQLGSSAVLQSKAASEQAKILKAQATQAQAAARTSVLGKALPTSFGGSTVSFSTQKGIPLWGWIVGGVAILSAVYFLFFKRKRRR